MADDIPQGFEDIVKNLPSLDEPSPKEQRIAVGVAMIRRGDTYSTAAKATGISQSTIWDHVNGIRPGADRNKALKHVEDKIESLAMAVSVEAGENILEGIQSNSWKPSDVVRAYQSVNMVVAKRRGWDAGRSGEELPTRDGLSGLLSQVRAGVKVTIEPADAVDEAIEVEGESLDE